ncbi:hypothetical protein L6252_02555 [Candidatus Parcubacteria bacterium]|nr:hypothetical protein [Candidatus Parcubacteria bacterium]
MKITNKTTLEKVLEIPKAEQILGKHKVPCLTCPMAKYEMAGLKIGDICQMYGIDEKELLKELNQN